jgi:predicted nucleotidyltransferase component of viral defense system
LISNIDIRAWRDTVAPWPDLDQIEQDLILNRIIIDIFSNPFLQGKVAIRGGTAINKMQFEQPLRYSEDIDLVQIQAEPIGPIVDAIRSALSWLGKCNREHAKHSMHLFFKFRPESNLEITLKIKVEINTREHSNLLGLMSYPFTMSSNWYSGTTEVTSFRPEELFGTKLRALLQRRKSRDLFDMYHGLKNLAMDKDKVIACFYHYGVLEGNIISRAIAEQRMLDKLSFSLIDDINTFLPVGTKFSDDDAIHAFEYVWIKLIVLLKGEPWKQTDKIVKDFRLSKYPTLLLGII